MTSNIGANTLLIASIGLCIAAVLFLIGVVIQYLGNKMVQSHIEFMIEHTIVDEVEEDEGND